MALTDVAELSLEKGVKIVRINARSLFNKIDNIYLLIFVSAMLLLSRKHG